MLEMFEAAKPRITAALLRAKGQWVGLGLEVRFFFFFWGGGEEHGQRGFNEVFFLERRVIFFEKRKGKNKKSDRKKRLILRKTPVEKLDTEGKYILHTLLDSFF